MSAIGDYIHLSQQGYLEHGISRTQEFSAIGNLSTLKKRVAAEAKARIEFTNREATRKLLTELEEIAAGISSGDPKYANQRAAIEQYLQNTYVDKIKSVDWSNLTVEAMKGSPNTGVGKVHAEHSGLDGRGPMQLKGSFENLAKKMEKLTTTLAAAIPNITDIQKANALKGQIGELQRLYQQAFNLDAQNAPLYGMAPSKKIANYKAFSNFRTMFNELAEKYAPLPPINLYEGTLWEALIAAIASIGAEVGIDEIYGVIDQAVVGDKNIKVEKNYKNFIASEVVKNTQKTVTQNIHRDTKRRKVDVSLTWKGQALKISAKNIRINSANTYKWITVVDDTPLPNLLEAAKDQSSINMINHYLNLFTLHSNSIANGAEPDKITYKIRTAGKKQIQDAMKAYLFFSSLSGKEQGDINNVFAVHDKATNRIRFVLMDDLIDKIAKTTKNISIKLGDSYMDKGVYFPQKWFPNEGEKKPEYERIAQLLYDLHAVKVRASFNMIGLIDF